MNLCFKREGVRQIMTIDDEEGGGFNTQININIKNIHKRIKV